jgi:hypothetical protein
MFSETAKQFLKIHVSLVRLRLRAPFEYTAKADAVCEPLIFRGFFCFIVSVGPGGTLTSGLSGGIIWIKVPPHLYRYPPEGHYGDHGYKG